MQLLQDLALLCRPHHWTKNAFVLGPFLFSGAGGARTALIAAGAFASFCLWASAVYAVNDVIDAERDRLHPRKRTRPVAAGRLSPAAAILWSTALACGGALLAAAALPGIFLLWGALYLANGLLYSAWLRNCVLLDVFAIAFGFVLRIIAGCAAIDVQPSSWILVCGFSVALLLAFGKRRLEINEPSDVIRFRAALAGYSKQKLDLLLAICASASLISYMLYTVAPETVQLHHTNKLIYTAPFVAFGVFRFLLKAHDQSGDGPVEVLTRDPIFLANAALWLLSVAVVLYAA